METLQESTATTPSSTGLFGTKIPATAAFLIAIILFLLPFAEIKCNGTAVANNTGLGIALGSEWKEVVSKKIFGDDLGNTNKNKGEFNQKNDPNIFAMIAFVLAVAGFLISLLSFKGAGKINLFVGLLAVISLIAMLIDLNSKAKSDNSIRSSELNVNASIKISVAGTAWFYITIILLLSAALFSWMRRSHKAS